ncbi:uncharacterized protein [Arachis hypogaea]|uniref:uncharacterized protein n=1 Tax=Arachis hypogaea TaxID=3818 RepID=UPI003B213CFA
MKKGIVFDWTPACEEAFKHFKEIISAPPILGKPKGKEALYLYLVITDEVLAAVLVREEGKVQQLVYFVSKTLQGAELRYNKLKKLAYALLTSPVGCDNIFKDTRNAIKAQAMADFLVEVTGNPTETLNTWWKLHVDGASNQTSGGAGIILENPTGFVYEQSVKFEFPVSNNQAEYEVLLGGLVLAREVGATRLEICSDSQVVTSQINGTYQARDSLLQKYLEKVKELSKQFEEVTVQYVPRERNTRADVLSKLASTKPGTGNRSLIQGLVKEPAVTLHLSQEDPSWMDPITDFLESGKLPSDEKSAKATRREAAKIDLLGPFPIGPGQVKYLIVAIDYYTEWVEAEPLASISSANCQKFMWRQVIARFGIPEVVISDNGTQFADKKFGEFLVGLGIKQKFSSMEHPQTNGQVEAANKVILQGLKKRLDQKKEAWADELASVLWSYRTTQQFFTGETLFRLTYGVEAIIPVEIGEPSPRLLLGGVGEAVEKDLIDEAREMAHLSETALKQRMALRYNANVLKREFEQDDLVLRRNDIGLPTPGEGKLMANWESPYRVKEMIGNGAYKLERLDGKEVSRTWNAGNLRRFYS